MKKIFYLISLFALLSVLTSCNKKEIESRQPLSDEDSVLYLIDYCSTFDKSIIPSVIVDKWYPYCEVSKSEMQDERLTFPLLFGKPWPGKGTADYTFSNDKTCFYHYSADVGPDENDYTGEFEWVYDEQYSLLTIRSKEDPNNIIFQYKIIGYKDDMLVWKYVDPINSCIIKVILRNHIAVN